MAKLKFDVLAASLVSPSQSAEGKAIYAALLLQALSQPPVGGKLVAGHTTIDLSVGLALPDTTVVRCLDSLVKGGWISKTESGEYAVGEHNETGFQFYVGSTPKAEQAPRTPTAADQVNAMLAQLRENKSVRLLSRVSVTERKAMLGVSTKKTPVARIVDVFESLVVSQLKQPFQRVLDPSGQPSIKQDYIYAKRFLSYATSETAAVSILQWLVSNWKTFVTDASWVGPCNLQVVGSVRGFSEVQRLRAGTRKSSAGDRFSGTTEGNTSDW